MDTLTRDDLRQLVETNGKWHVSIYLPMHRAGNEQQQDHIRYAAVQTIVSSGNVYALPADSFPGDGDVAAILRYVI